MLRVSMVYRRPNKARRKAHRHGWRRLRYAVGQGKFEVFPWRGVQITRARCAAYQEGGVSNGAAGRHRQGAREQRATRVCLRDAQGAGGGTAGCASTGQGEEDGRIGPDGELYRPQNRAVQPGLTVLLNDSIRLIAGKRVGLITNQTGVDERGRSGIDLLFSDSRAQKADVQLVALFSPEHGIRGTEDRPNISSTRDEKTKLPIYSLYGATTVAPPDSALKTIEVLLIDLQDVGTRTWTYVGAMLYAMRAAGEANIPVLVLDRPNPITGRVPKAHS